MTVKFFSPFLWSYLFIFAFFLVSRGTAQTRLGNVIVGEAAEDQSGYAVSMPTAFTIAIGAPGNDGAGNLSGHVRIYDWNGEAWLQRGQDIDGEMSFNEAGAAVSMPNGNTVAIGAIRNDASESNIGHVRVYDWRGEAWVQRGMDIDGQAKDDFFGTAVDMPTANTLAVGAPGGSLSGSDAGYVRIYDWNGDGWTERGQGIEGEERQDFFGSSLAMSDSNTIAIGAPRNDDWARDAGQVRMYDWDGTAWQQRGSDIDGESRDDRSGVSLSMPTGTTVAIGASGNDGTDVDAGHVRVYDWNGMAW
ncbi:MAG: hypothetical protein AAFV25_18530, partial [Bacteroidota bacterium]